MGRRQWIPHGLLELIPRVHSYVRGLAHNDHLVQEFDNRKVLIGSLYRRIYTLNVIWYIRVFRIARTQYAVYTNLNNDVHTGIQYQNHVNVILVLRERN